MSKQLSDSYPGNTTPLSDEDLKAVVSAKYSAEHPKPQTVAGPINQDQDISKFHTEVVSLPSQGVLYPETNPLHTGQLNMKYMTAKEEDILTSQNLIKTGVVIDKLLQSLIVDNIRYDDLLIGDKNAVLIAARILAYGKDYDVEISCPKCAETSKHVIDLTLFDEKNLQVGEYSPGVNEFWFELPASKRKVSYKCLTSGDERSIENELKGLKKISKISGVDPEMTTRLKYIITSVDGNTDINFIRSFVDKELFSRDSFALRKEIQKITPDIKMEFPFECPNCSHEDPNMGMPLDVGFFWPRV